MEKTDLQDGPHSECRPPLLKLPKLLASGSKNQNRSIIINYY